MVRTDHILFIAAGAFHVSKPSDLIPELQGRFPIRVELEALGKDEFVRILTEPRSALVKQYIALMDTEGIDARRSPTMRSSAIADFATIVNERTENIGARRLHTVMEKLLDEISFEGPDLVEQARHDRRRLRDEDARRHRQERRPVAVHSVTRLDAEPLSRELAERARRARVRCRRCFWRRAARRARRCRRSSSCRCAPADFAAARRGDDVDLQFTVRPPTPTARVRPTSSASTSTRSPAGDGAADADASC